jgi:ABC-2 type transport system permease protein
VHPILTNTLVNNLAFKSLIFTVFVPIWLALYLLFQPDYSGVSWQSVLLALPAIAIGFGINFLLGATLTCLAFWTTRVYSIDEFYYALSALFSGQFVPLMLLPPVAQRVAGFLPFQFYIYFPVQIILGELPLETMLRTYGLGVAWLVVAYLLFLWIWRAGVKRFSAVGA